jgi:hypothetical protein
MTYAIEAAGLVKRFGKTLAVDEVDLAVSPPGDGALQRRPRPGPRRTRGQRGVALGGVEHRHRRGLRAARGPALSTGRLSR